MRKITKIEKEELLKNIVADLGDVKNVLQLTSQLILIKWKDGIEQTFKLSRPTLLK